MEKKKEIIEVLENYLQDYLDEYMTQYLQKHVADLRDLVLPQSPESIFGKEQQDLQKKIKQILCSG